MNQELKTGPSRVVLLAVIALAQACGGSGGGSEGSGGVSSACASAPSAGLGGLWHVTSEVVELDPDVSEDYIPMGLDEATLLLVRVFDYSEEGSCWSAYTVGSGALVTASPSGLPTTLQGLASSTIDDTLLLSGLYYYPEGNVTVDIRLVPGPHSWLSDTVFSIEIPFRTYEGNQIVSVTEGNPGEDDDGDGLVDEEDETDLDDVVDAGAVLMCKGRARLQFSRTLHHEGAMVAEVALIGEFRARDHAEGKLAEVHLHPGSNLVRIGVRGLPEFEAGLWLSTLADASGEFGAQVIRNGSQIGIRGGLSSGRLDECVLTILSEHRADRLEFVPRPR